MPVHLTAVRHLSPFVLAILLVFASSLQAIAQSQEPKPTQPATPVARANESAAGLPETGISGASWESPNWGISVAWDPAVWAVENEQIVAGYDGLQIGTPASTVFIEAYEGFAGDADACLDDAEREINERERVSEVATLSGRPLPEIGNERGPAELFGVVATLPDDTIYRGVEYIECRTIEPGAAVLELTWQTSTDQFNAELPAVETLLSAIEVPGDGSDQGFPDLPGSPPVITPNTARSGDAA